MTQPAKVLVVDDDEFMRALLKRTFESAEVPVELFGSAQEFLRDADLESPGVVLLDVKMPGVSGIELQAILVERGVALPIMFLTGASDVPMAVLAMRNGAVDFVEKPFASQDLVERVRRAMVLLSQPAAQRIQHPKPVAATRLDSLTVREREVHDLMIAGKTSKQIAFDLGGSFRTVETHRARVMAKMEASNLAELVRMSFKSDIH